LLRNGRKTVAVTAAITWDRPGRRRPLDFPVSWTVGCRSSNGRDGPGGTCILQMFERGRWIRGTSILLPAASGMVTKNRPRKYVDRSSLVRRMGRKA
jgi:hypothetical protein